MKSQNFEFLRPQWPDLATLAAFAEHYAGPDPASAAIKLRTFAEQAVDYVYHKFGLTKPFQFNLNDLLCGAGFLQAVPRVVISKLHALRITGNHAAHGGDVSGLQAKYLLKESYDLARWLAMTFASAAASSFADFVEPTIAPPASKNELQREKKAVLEKLAAAEAQMQQLLADLEATRARATQAEATASELRLTFTTGQRAADTLAFSEAVTRKRLVDTALIAAGWDVALNGASNSSVGQEIEVLYQPTDSGKGYADYVLWGDNGKPLAVIEAKKTAKNPGEGRTQAKLYADGLEKMTGQRPIIFYANGFETWIWNDAVDEPERKVYGFYAKESLEYRIFHRTRRKKATEIAPKDRIINRMYQYQAVKQVIERFAAKHFSALIVQATGTGKTRVAVALSDALIDARWAKRVLFLCDRRELRKQAANTFKEFVPSEPRTVVSSETYKDRDSRIYLATYPAMMKCFETFDVGFFDLIIADESHRSIYNRYRDLFLYFDAPKVGLTATPVQFISRNTYKLFGCEDRDPTAFYSYEEAISHNPPFLVPFKVETHTTPFMELGIKYSQMPEDQRRQLEEQEVEPDAIEFEPAQVNKAIFNKDTNRLVLRNLMENGIKIRDGTQLGKTIIFARNHNHAILLQSLFDELYPQYGGKFCRVIDNYDPRAEELIDEFKDPENPLTIAVSVDMLDTGIDVPEVVNLVFAKPIFSFVKFWQMLGRGTRLRENLFGPGKHKTHFMVFDHWKVFEFFDYLYQPSEPSDSKSLLQRLFESRITLADVAQNKPDLVALDIAMKLLGKDIADLPEKTIAVKEKWKQVQVAQNELAHKQYQPATRAVLLQDIAPLMQWRDADGDVSAFALDNLIAKMQVELLRQSGRFIDLKDELLNSVDQLQMHLNPVRARAEMLASLRTQAFWDAVSVKSLDEAREQLRGIMRYRLVPASGSLPPKIVDVKEDESQVKRKEYKPKLAGLELAAYRKRVEQVLHDLFDNNPTLKRIKAGQPVSEDDLAALNSLVLTQNPDLDLSDLIDYYPETAGHLDLAIRSIIGLDAAAVADRFEKFVQKHPSMNSRQIKFLDLLQNYISKYGRIEIGRLYEAPFTSLHSDGPDGLFQEPGQLDELLSLLETFSPAVPNGKDQSPA
jgi:type I restriction enzyme R subunit